MNETQMICRMNEKLVNEKWVGLKMIEKGEKMTRNKVTMKNKDE